MDEYNPGYESDTPEEAIRAIFGNRADALLKLLAQNNMRLGGWMPGKSDPRVDPGRRAFGLMPPSGAQSSLAALITQAISAANRSRSFPLDGIPEQFVPGNPTGEQPMPDPAGRQDVDQFDQRLRNLEYMRQKNGVNT